MQAFIMHYILDITDINLKWFTNKDIKKLGPMKDILSVVKMQKKKTIINCFLYVAEACK